MDFSDRNDWVELYMVTGTRSRSVAAKFFFQLARWRSTLSNSAITIEIFGNSPRVLGPHPGNFSVA